MNFHPHIHAIVLGGELDVKNHWKDNGKDFFLPIKAISKTFRGKYMAELKQLWENDRLEFHGSAAPYKNYYTFYNFSNILKPSSKASSMILLFSSNLVLPDILLGSQDEWSRLSPA